MEVDPSGLILLYEAPSWWSRLKTRHRSHLVDKWPRQLHLRSSSGGDEHTARVPKISEDTWRKELEYWWDASPLRKRNRSPLCDRCWRLKLSVPLFRCRLIKGGLSSTNLGSLREIIRKVDRCPLCRLIVDIAFLQPEVCKAIQTEEHIKCTIRCDKFYGSCRRRLAVHFSHSGYDPNRSHEFYLTPLVDGLSGSEGFIRPVSETQITFEQVKSWLKACEESHGLLCNYPRPSDSMILPSLLIDTERNCLVRPCGYVRYATLSYVWGGQRQVCTTKDNVEHLTQASSLSEIDLPATITDAITLTKTLGEHFLWIDVLCIIQDDLERKQEAIRNMQSIYKNSIFTIVASGKDAAAGLPGVRPDSRGGRQLVGDILPGLKLVWTRHIEASLARSPYSTRAWTYQERLLSRKCLVFVDGMVSLMCRKCVQREDIYRDLVSCKDTWDNSHRDILADPYVALDKSADGKYNPYFYYANYVAMISGRHLTFAADILNASEGILSTITSVTGGRLICGILEAGFDWAILWQHRGYAIRREGFSSWSWAGWIGPVKEIGTMFLTYKDDGGSHLREWLETRTWIDWEVIEASGDVSTVNTHKKRTGREDDHKPLAFRKYQNNPATDHSFRSARNLPTTQIFLHFWTLSVTFSITRGRRFYDLWRKRSPYEDSTCFGILDRSGNLVGDVQIGDLWRLGADDAPMEFVLISRLNFDDLITPNHFGFVQKKGEMIQVKDVGLEHLNGIVEPLEKILDGSTLYTCLAIAWNGPRAVRIGTGYILADKIDNAHEPGPLWKEVYLE